MHFIYHFLSFVCFSIGFMTTFCLPIKKKKTFIILLLFLSGLAIGIHEHIAYQDAWDYDKSVYEDLVLNVNQRVPNPLKQIICLILYNDNEICPPKYDSRWDEPGFWRETK